ncbi:hypothetical protein Lal_00039945 [Lupinus albus]|nr:hypothetical protein Lal_00039945 [Lupinus albus]
MSSSNRIKLLMDSGTWNPMDDDMVSLDPVEFHSEEEPYKDCIDFYQRKIGLTEAVQTYICQLNGRLVAIRIIYFQFMGGSMGSVVGQGAIPLTQIDENLTPREIEQAAKLPYFLCIPIDHGYENPQEAIGRNVCANFNLANKVVDVEVPQTIHPNTVFEAVVRIPYAMQVKRVLPNCKNKRRGQIYPDGSMSNNNIYNATKTGIVNKIIRKEKGEYEIIIVDASDGRDIIDIIPPRPKLLVSQGELIKLDQPLMSNPNVGGLVRGMAEIVLQDPIRVQGLLFFLSSISMAQIVLVLKRKQFEKVQLSKMNF